MDRFYLLAPALTLAAAFFIAFFAYSGLHLIGRPPQMVGVKHNQVLGPFWAGFIVWILGPMERLFVGRVSPNFVTAISLLLCICAGFAAGTAHLGTAVWLYVFGGILDILDGRLARLTGIQTKSGALFDSVSDRWGELFVFGGYTWYLHDSLWMLSVVAAIGTSQMVSYTRARAEGLGIHLSGGIMQRAERILLVTLGALLAAWLAADPDSAAWAAPILGGTMAVCALTSGATALSRWLQAYRVLAQSEAELGHSNDVPAQLPVAARLPAAAMTTSDLHKIRPLEQH